MKFNQLTLLFKNTRHISSDFESFIFHRFIVSRFKRKGAPTVNGHNQLL